MSVISTIGLDTAKRHFQVHGVDENGKPVLRKKLSRSAVIPFFSNLPACVVGLEASCGSHYWARELEKCGHTVKQMSPQYVIPYIKSNKNDMNDAEGICEAVTRPNMRFVPTKSVEQQDILALHRIRERLVGNRTALANQIRGLLMELGMTIPQGIRKLRTLLPEIYEDTSNRLSLLERDYLSDLYTDLVELDAKINKYSKKIEEISRTSEKCRLLETIPGIGALTATALVAAVGDAKNFKNGRQMAAWLGLVPKQHSSGGKTSLRSISKRGDVYLRCLFMHGARATISHLSSQCENEFLWLRAVIDRRGIHKAIAAQANKTVRIAWAVLMTGEEYQKPAYSA